MGQIARHLSIVGRVQGVFFRSWSREQAEELGVAGWIRNRPDGHVEAHVEGELGAVEQMIERLRDGPPSAQVDDVRIWDADVFDFDGFEVRH
ncbi:MAG TPA: acylphosphatase [Sphingomicrobium sp.]|jgi:acylphosphatase|nr:acylphosphatase [Sphingomicrobium sp.]